MAKSKFPPLLHLTYVLQQASEELLLREAGVSLSHARIMSGLSPSIAKSQRQLAVELRQTEANISRQLQAMKKLGLVSITKNKKDGRQRDVKLTAKGSGKYQKAEELLVKEQSNLVRLVDFDAQKLLTNL
ncbi:MAG TPA: MarR family winged helix-turn-helix transcriptional regulator [Candidatus Saccharimonadales bacterium]|nr:MarR family winged helix-turn-helix transcriptional regulator [Candidatus Saccharimonadales bacterium]